jgi:hypothetical protein
MDCMLRSVKEFISVLASRILINIEHALLRIFICDPSM